jgi:hypothetical protein
MTHALKVEAYKELMATRGIGSSTAAPPLWQLCWSLGLEIPPPLFLGSPMLFLFTGTTFGVLFSLGAWILGNRGARSMPLSKAGWVALITSTFFGLAMACITEGWHPSNSLVRGPHSAQPGCALNNSFKPKPLRGSA